MIQPQPQGRGGMMKAEHYVLVAAIAVVGAIVAFAVLSFLGGIVVEVVKIAVVVAVVAAAFVFVSRRAKRSA